MYNFTEIEKKWQNYWKENNTFKVNIWDFSKPKYYALDMFPYPSGVGLHAGHPEGYTATDIISRMKRMQGYNVLHPIGYDSFGLPAEQYAIQTGNHPAEFTQKNIKISRKKSSKLVENSIQIFILKVIGKKWVFLKNNRLQSLNIKIIWAEVS